jgi:hypothetical protein
MSPGVGNTAVRMLHTRVGIDEYGAVAARVLAEGVTLSVVDDAAELIVRKHEEGFVRALDVVPEGVVHTIIIIINAILLAQDKVRLLRTLSGLLGILLLLTKDVKFVFVFDDPIARNLDSFERS